MSPRAYLGLFSAVTALLLFAVAGFIWIVNPLGIYAPPAITGVNGAHPAAELYSFVQKTEMVKRLKPDAIITGTSRAEICLDPGSRYFDGFRAYNFALPSASVHEQRLMLEFAQAAHPLKRALVTLDFFAFDARKRDTPAYDAARLSPAALRQPRAFFDTLSPLVSFDMLYAAWLQLSYMDALDRHAYVNDRGLRVPNDYAYIIAKGGAAWPFTRGKFGDPTLEDPTRRIGSAALNHFRAMVAFAYDNNIDAQFMILPLHEKYFGMLKATGQDDFMQRWERMLRRIIKDVAAEKDRPPFPLHDFSFRRGFSDEAVPPAGDMRTRMQWFWDPSHCTAALGDEMLRRIYANRALQTP